MINKSMAVVLLATGLIVAGCSSDDDDRSGDADGMTTAGATDGLMPTEPTEADDPGPYDASGATEGMEAFAAVNAAQFSTLLAAITFAQDAFVGLPTDETPGTLFAPTNDAFEAAGITEDSLASMDPATVAATLDLHVIPAVVYAKDFLATQDGRFLVTAGGNVDVRATGSTDAPVDAEGDPVEAAGDAVVDGDETDASPDVEGGVTVGGVALDSEDVAATNGIIHPVFALLTASTDATDAGTDVAEPVTGGDGLFGDIADNPELTSFAALVSEELAAMLDDVGNPDNVFTVFAPTNEAVAAADLSGLDGEVLDERIRQHVVRSAFGVPELDAVVEEGNGQLPALAGTAIAISGNSLTGFVLNGSTAVTPAAAPSANGFIHTIDTVLTLR